jgi:hypothetical protein
MWQCQLWNSAWEGQAAGSQGRIDVREPRGPLIVKDVGIYATASNSTVSLLNPATPDYAGAAREVYLDRLRAIRTASTKKWGLNAGNTLTPWLPGPYGSILTGVYHTDVTWIGLAPYWGDSTLLAIHDEIGDSAGDGSRPGHGLLLPVSYRNCAGFKTGIADGATGATADITYVNLPSDWSMVADTNTYIDRAEFLENALDTVTDYTKTESTTRNVQIMSPMAACQVRGNGSTWVNGFYRQASWNLVDDRVIEGYVYIPAGPTGSVAANIIVGASDGSGQ